MTAEILTIITGVSGIFGFLSLVAYLVYLFLHSSPKRNLREQLSGEHLLHSDKIVDVIQSMASDESKIEAIKVFGDIDRASAKALLEKTKKTVDLDRLSEREYAHQMKLSGRLSVALLSVALLAVFVQWQSSRSIPNTMDHNVANTKTTNDTVQTRSEKPESKASVSAPNSLSPNNIAISAPLVIDFEGLKVGDCVDNFYAGGTSRAGFRANSNLHIRQTMPCPDGDTVIERDAISGSRSYYLGWLQFERDQDLTFPLQLNFKVKASEKSQQPCTVDILSGLTKKKISLIERISVESKEPKTIQVRLPPSQNIVMIRSICSHLVIDDVVFFNPSL
jgi:hypothetical protein